MALRSLIALLLVNFLMVQASALTTAQMSVAEIHLICKKSPAECIPVINENLLKTAKKSRIWFDLMQYKIEALFLLQDIDQLHEVTKPWINEEDLPIPFKISVYIYYAKSVRYTDENNADFVKSEHKKYIQKAEGQLSLMNDAYPDPMLLIQLANLKMFAGEYQEAYQSLQSLELKYRKHPNPEIKLDLYGNLAHLADHLNYKKQAVFYWLECLIWAKEFNNTQQIATVYYNLANSQVNNQEFTEAKQSYLSAIYHSTAANDDAKRAQSQYFLAKLMIQQGLITQAKEILKTIDYSKLPNSMNEDLQLIKDPS